MLYYITWSEFIVWLPLFVEILGNMCIATCACFSGWGAINFEINFISLIKPRFYMAKKLRQK